MRAYLNNQVSRDEFDRLFSTLAQTEDEDFREMIVQTLNQTSDTAESDFFRERTSLLYPKILKTIESNPPHSVISREKPPAKRFRLWWKATAAVAAASVILYMAIHVWPQWHGEADQVAAVAAEDILPGGNRATLILNDGRSINLNSRKSGIIIGDNLTYLDGSQVLDAQERRELNTLRLITPNGGQYQITLADGSRVTLNAASALTYPAEFTGDLREVTLEGEAYFEVAKNTGKPFIVHTPKQRLEVLGTSFNIQAYSNETAVKTTVLTGSVRVSRGADSGAKQKSRILIPRQQSIVSDSETEIHVRTVDPESVIAWKNGLFNFHGLSIDESLKQVGRWYDVRILYKGKVPEGYLGGKMSRGVKLSTFLAFLEKDFHIKSEMEADRTVVLHATADTVDN